MTDSEKVQYIKDLHLLTRTRDEWDEKFKRFRGDATEIMAQISRECEEKYPYVDLDSFLWSYSEFGNGTALRGLLNPNRSSFGHRLRYEPDFLASVMCSLLGYPGCDYRDIPKFKGDIFHMLQALDLPVVLLMFFPFGDEPLLPPFNKKVGDLDDSIDLYSLVMSSLRDFLVRLYPPCAMTAEKPFLDKACEALSPRAVGPTAKKVTIMDVVNLVYGVFCNISVNTNTSDLRYANDAVLESRVFLDLPDKLWRTDRGHFCRIEAFADGYMLTLYYRGRDAHDYRAKYFLSVFTDDDGQIMAYMESSTAFRHIINGDKLTSKEVAYCALKLYDGEALLERITSDELRPTRIVFENYPGARPNESVRHMPFCNLTVVDTPTFDTYNDDVIESADPDEDFNPKPLVWHLTENYVYVQCTAEQVSLKAADGSQVSSFRVTSWYRLPRLSLFSTTRGDKINLLSVGEDDIVSIRSFVENGRRREFIIFLNLSLFVEVTHIKNPEVGFEFPGGITIVPSASSTLNAQIGGFMRVAKAVYRGDSKADVTYEVYSRADDAERSVTVCEDVLVVGE